LYHSEAKNPNGLGEMQIFDKLLKAIASAEDINKVKMRLCYLLDDVPLV
jgi:hypothetical protein